MTADHPPHALALTVLRGGGVLVEAGGPALLVDAGGTAQDRLARHGADPVELEAVLLTRLDVERSGGLAPVVQAAHARRRPAPLRIVGPGGRPGATGTCRFVETLFGERGAWRDLRMRDGFALEVVECQGGTGAHGALVCSDGLVVHATGLQRAARPAVAYRIAREGCSVVVCGDPAAEEDRLSELAAGCDALVCQAGTEDRQSAVRLGRVAAASGCGMVVVCPDDGEDDPGEILESVQRRYDGPLVAAEDLTTLRIGATRRARPEAPTAVAGVPF